MMIVRHPLEYTWPTLLNSQQVEDILSLLGVQAMLIIRYPIKYEQIQVAFVLVKMSIYFESSKIGQFWCESF